MNPLDSTRCWGDNEHYQYESNQIYNESAFEITCINTGHQVLQWSWMIILGLMDHFHEVHMDEVLHVYGTWQITEMLISIQLPIWNSTLLQTWFTLITVYHVDNIYNMNQIRMTLMILHEINMYIFFSSHWSQDMVHNLNDGLLDDIDSYHELHDIGSTTYE